MKITRHQLRNIVRSTLKEAVEVDPLTKRGKEKKKQAREEEFDQAAAAEEAKQDHLSTFHIKGVIFNIMRQGTENMGDLPSETDNTQLAVQRSIQIEEPDPSTGRATNKTDNVTIIASIGGGALESFNALTRTVSDYANKELGHQIVLTLQPTAIEKSKPRQIIDFLKGQRGGYKYQEFTTPEGEKTLGITLYTIGGKERKIRYTDKAAKRVLAKRIANLERFASNDMERIIGLTDSGQELVQDLDKPPSAEDAAAGAS